MTKPRPKTDGQIIAEAFDCTVTVTHRDGKRVRPDPEYMSWPMVRGDEFVSICDMVNSKNDKGGKGLIVSRETNSGEVQR